MAVHVAFLFVDDVHPAGPGKALHVSVFQENVVLQHAADGSGPAVVVKPFESLAFGQEDLSLRRDYAKVRVHIVQIGLYYAVKAVVNGKDEDECRGAYGHSRRAYRRYYVDYIVRFACEQIAQGYVRRRFHFLSNSSMCSA